MNRKAVWLLCALVLALLLSGSAVTSGDTSGDTGSATGGDGGDGCTGSIPSRLTCTREVVVVCGCNGYHYLNDCDARSHGVLKSTYGLCAVLKADDPNHHLITRMREKKNARPPVIDWKDPLPAEVPTPSPRPPSRPPHAHAHAAPATAHDNCRGPKPSHRPCSLEYQPVCGCDGDTYTNACDARMNGIKQFTSGACVVASTEL